MQIYRLFGISLALWLGAGWVVAQSPRSQTETVSYALRNRSAEEISRVLRPLVESAPDVVLRQNEADDRLTLTGPPWSHELLETVLRRMDQRPTEAVAASVLSTPRPVSDVLSPDLRSSDTVGQARQRVPLLEGTSDAVRQELTSLLDHESATAEASPRDLGRVVRPAGPTLWTVQTARGPVRIQCDVTREEIFVDGPIGAVDQVTKMVEAISRASGGQFGPSGRVSVDRELSTVRVVRLPRDVQPALESMLQASRLAIGREPGGRVEQPKSRAPVQIGPFRFAANQVGENGSVGPDGSDDDGGNRQDRPALPSDVVLPQLEGIDIETLPDLDAIILRGRNRDIDQLAEIIRQLELLSRQTQPTIEMVGLLHSDSASIVRIIEQTQSDLIGTRQGRAAAIALGKPNAVLLIGWGEAVKAIQELIDKLDRPVRPQTQFAVFRLKHAAASTIQQTLQTFFANRPAEMSPTILSTVDQRTNSVIVHAAPRDLDEVAQLIENLDVPQGDAIHQTRVFEIRNSLANDVAETLRLAIASPAGTQQPIAMELLVQDDAQAQRIVSGVLENIQITVNARKNSLIISAPATNFDLIEALIRQLDSEGTVAKIKIFPIRNGDAASLVETLRALLPSQVGTAAPVVQLSVAPGDSSLVPLRFTVDVRSNSIIATGSEGDLRIVDALVLRLDESDAMQRRNTVYQLKNAPAVDVALAINEFLRNTRQVEAAGPGAVNPFQQLEKEVVVVPEPVSNKLVLSATPRYFEEIEALIEKLDEQPPQVMIQVLIAEVTLGNAEEFGVELGLQDSVLFDRGLLGDLVTLTQTTQTSTPAGIVTETTEPIIGATNSPGFNFNNNPLGNSGSTQALAGAAAVGAQGLSNFDVGRGNAELGFGGLVLSASSQNINVLLRALEESRRMQVLSRPQILTLDNQPAFIQVGQRVPRIVASSLNQIGQQNQIALENVGLILGVTPRISPEGNVVMEIDAEKSDVGPESEGIPISISAEGGIIRSPRVNVSSAQATVSAADGETIILGGLITNSQREIHRKVPLLGDLPLLRYLFRFDSMIQKRTELLIILTPRVIRTVEDADRLKQVELARMSWCAADVFDLHGDVFTNPDIRHAAHEEASLEVIYPHENPRGERVRRGEVMPVETDRRDYGDPIYRDNLQPGVFEGLPAPPRIYPPVESSSVTLNSASGQAADSSGRPIDNSGRSVGGGLRRMFTGGGK